MSSPTRRRWSWLGAAGAAAIVVLSACSSPPVTTSDATEPPASMPTATSATLPEGVPLYPGATIVDGPTPIPEKRGITGWTALAGTPADVLRTTIADTLTASLTAGGWAVAPAAASTDAATFTARKGATTANSADGQWLVVTVTNPVNDAGPAISYRYANSPKATQ